MGHRILWSAGMLGAWLAYSHRGLLIETLRQRRAWGIAAVSGLCLAINWWVYIWGIAQHRVFEASLGYFIVPLVNVFFGTVFLKEKLNRIQWTAVGLAALAVAYAVFSFGNLPWVAIALALSFGFYGLVRKVGKLPSAVGLLLELVIITPLALALITWGRVDEPILWNINRTTLLLLGAGPVTVIPLITFANAVKVLPYSTMGLFQYLAPTGKFFLAIFFFHEPITFGRWMTFSMVWVSLAIFTYDLLQRRPAREKSLRPG